MFVFTLVQAKHFDLREFSTSFPLRSCKFFIDVLPQSLPPPPPGAQTTTATTTTTTTQTKQTSGIKQYTNRANIANMFFLILKSEEEGVQASFSLVFVFIERKKSEKGFIIFIVHENIC